MVHDTACRRGSSAEVWKRGPSSGCRAAPRRAAPRRARLPQCANPLRSVPLRLSSGWRDTSAVRERGASGSNPDPTPFPRARYVYFTERGLARARVSTPQCPREAHGACVVRARAINPHRRAPRLHVRPRRVSVPHVRKTELIGDRSIARARQTIRRGRGTIGDRRRRQHVAEVEGVVVHGCRFRECVPAPIVVLSRPPSFARRPGKPPASSV